MYDFYAVIRTFNDLNMRDLTNECKAEKWAPILVLRYKDKIVVPLFRSASVATNFVKRNVPRKEICGIMGFPEQDLPLLNKWKIEWHTFPKKYTDRKDVSVEVDVLNVESEFDLFTSKSRKSNI